MRESPGMKPGSPDNKTGYFKGCSLAIPIETDGTGRSGTSGQFPDENVGTGPGGTLPNGQNAGGTRAIAPWPF
jgi:hypothetical protein